MARRKLPPPVEPLPSFFDLDELPRMIGITVRAEFVIMAFHKGKLHILMIRRENEPHAWRLSLPGQYIDEHRSAEQMADIISLKLKLEFSRPRLSGFYSRPGRDSRHRATAACYMCVADWSNLANLTKGDHRFKLISFDPHDGSNMWFDGSPINPERDIAFDHGLMIRDAFFVLQDSVRYTAVAFQFLGSQFTLSEFQTVYEALTLQPESQMRFRKRMLARDFGGGWKLRPTGGLRSTSGRPARLYELRRDVSPPRTENKTDG